MNLLQTIEAEILTARERQKVDVRAGDTVRMHIRIKEGEKTRVQIFEGTVIRIKRGGPRSTITVRKMSAGGVGVERIFPASSPNIAKIEVTARHKVRRAKLHFLRGRKGKAARLKPIREFRAIREETTTRRKRRGKRGKRKSQAPA